MNVYTFLVNSFATNSYIYKDPLSNSCFIVDPGGEIGDIVQCIKNFNLQVTNIVITHCHIDHIASLEKIVKIYPVEVIVHKEEFRLCKDNEKNLSIFFGTVLSTTFFEKTKFFLVSDKIIFSCGNQKVKVIHTPGHTPGSICLCDYFL